jgi:hypothetical protein
MKANLDPKDGALSDFIQVLERNIQVTENVAKDPINAAKHEPSQKAEDQTYIQISRKMFNYMKVKI